MRWFTQPEVTEPDFVVFAVRRIIESREIQERIRLLLLIDLHLTTGEIMFLLNETQSVVNSYIEFYHNNSPGLKVLIPPIKVSVQAIVDMYGLYKTVADNPQITNAENIL